MNLSHIGTLVIETERLLLRKFTFADSNDMFETWANDKVVTRYVSWDAHENINVTQSIITNWLDGYREKSYYNWAITIKSSNKLIGSIGVVNINEDDKSCELGYAIGKKYWNKGYTTEAVSAVIDFSFMEIGFLKISAIHHIENKASGKVMEKCSMIYDGIKESIPFKGGHCSVASYHLELKSWFTLPYSDFLSNVEPIIGNEVILVCGEKLSADLNRGYVPSYEFDIIVKDKLVGAISLRVGFNEGIYYAGHIGYRILEKHRGHNYAQKAVKLLLPLAHSLGIKRVIITVSPDNIASVKTCQNLGAQLIRVVDIPFGNEMYLEGERKKNIYIIKEN